MAETILIVDDEVSIVTLLDFNIQQQGYKTEIAYNGKEAVFKINEGDFDLIILDLMLPGMGGMEVCKYVRDKNIYTPILMLTAKNEEENKIKGLELGADDYLTKPFSPKELIARINAILRRVQLSEKHSNTKIKIGNIEIYPDSYEVKRNGEELSFTRKEFELLLYLAANKGIALSRNLLLKEIWHYDFVGDTRMIDMHISNLRDKIEPSTCQPLYIKTIRGLGYKMEEPE